MDGRIEWRAPTKEGRGRAERKGGEDDVRCSVEDCGRISLTFRDVRTFLDVRRKRLFGQGVSSSMGTSLVIEDGVILEVSLRVVMILTLLSILYDLRFHVQNDYLNGQPL